MNALNTMVTLWASHLLVALSKNPKRNIIPVSRLPTLLAPSMQNGWTQRLLLRNLLFDNMGSMHISQGKGASGSGCSCWVSVELVLPIVKFGFE
ncbi:hypothetical protein RHGRI_032294 [Rhododendron griersonianum]|uniref:Secreted protein n=1 Tax=Rhododendron griersonianum TaxID=479676 RepID=A0AAV6IB72_9ERIC|nr:hypothetical protein RHGRI_032294 [Rhododendron griersonianum]